MAKCADCDKKNCNMVWEREDAFYCDSFEFDVTSGKFKVVVKKRTCFAVKGIENYCNK
jgi:hypothetical protein